MTVFSAGGLVREVLHQELSPCMSPLPAKTWSGTQNSQSPRNLPTKSAVLYISAQEAGHPSPSPVPAGRLRARTLQELHLIPRQVQTLLILRRERTHGSWSGCIKLPHLTGH